ncbi:rhomboid-like protein [Nocardia sp. SYP-A9097]|uniref:rhomboid-like protein n=1 Tax=Nocardia sp. SYP-A9097 TaxID=2663237 RepID=UPI0018916292|nr:rhomboid-like protein [Nocardia sp. SYP-A9097]
MSLRTYRPPWVDSVDIGDEIRMMRAWWGQPHRLRRAASAYQRLLAVAPAAIAYAFTLFVTWWTLRGASDIVGRRLILSASTNLRNMQRDPIQVLLASAFWTDGGFPWGDILTLLTVMALAERWLGSLRWILVVAAGHIGATLLTVSAISHAVARDMIPFRVTVASDVGPSYGISAMLAVMAYRLRGRVRLIYAVGLLIWYGFALWSGPTFTDYGHLLALFIGFAVGGLAVLFSRRLLAWRNSAARTGPTAERAAVPSDPGDGVESAAVPLEEPDGRLDHSGGDRAQYGHN